MKILKITKKDLDKDNYYIGEEDFSEYNKKYDGKIEIDCDLGTVRFKKGVYASYSIEAKSGSGISAGLELSIGLNIFAGVSRYINAQGDYKKITCSKLVKGTVCYGDLVETGEKEISLSGKEVSIELDGKNYTAVIK